MSTADCNPRDSSPEVQTQQQLDSVKAEICRLCRNEIGKNIGTIEDIFEQSANGSRGEAPPLAHTMSTVFGIEFKKHELLSKSICKNCLESLKFVLEYIEHVRFCENSLQKCLNKKIKLDVEFRPGVNGNEGEFVPDDDCEVIDVDPYEDIISTDGDFSLDSNSDADFFDDEDDEEDEIKLDASVVPAGRSASLQPFTGTNGLYNSMDQLPVSDPGIQPRTAYVCQYCDMAFTKHEFCTDHEQKQHNTILPYNCNFCAVRFPNRQTLIFHIRDQHDSNRPYVCPLCSKGFCRRSDLKKHTVVHTGVRPFTCNICSKSFSRNTNLTKHMRIHNGIKPHVCKFCPRSFQTIEELMRHAPTHAEVKPFKCARCPSSFNRRDKLQIHETMHTKRDAEQSLQKQGLGMPAENVRYPQESSDDVDNVHYHNSILANQLQQQQQPVASSSSAASVRPQQSRNYKCHLCEKSFQRQYDLQRHHALHLDELFTCKICDQNFVRIEQLTKHELEAHPPRFRCDYCLALFTLVEDLEAHLRTSHTMTQIDTSLTAPTSTMSRTDSYVSADNQLSAPSTTDHLIFGKMNLGFYNESHLAE